MKASVVFGLLGLFFVFCFSEGIFYLFLTKGFLLNDQKKRNDKKNVKGFLPFDLHLKQKTKNNYKKRVPLLDLHCHRLQSKRYVHRIWFIMNLQRISLTRHFPQLF
jgi:hypothetical protein